jgi:DNA polymerase III alpha subunit
MTTMPFLVIADASETTPDSSGLEAPDRLKKLCTLGRREQDAVVQQRLDHELQVIHELGLEDFFLALLDIHRFALNQGQVALLEGPASSSLVVHRLGLNPVNPLHHGLLFERFLDPDQTFAPMRQFSISEGGQEEVVRYARKKFGWDGTDGACPWRAYSRPWQSSAGEATDQATIDIVVHPGLTALKRTVALIPERHGPDAVPSQLPNNDEKTLELLSRGDTDDIYQLCSSRAQELLRKVQPDSIDDLAVVWSLSHDAPFENGVASEYLDQRTEKMSSPSRHPQLKEILDDTHGVLLYHEQVMEIVHRIGGLAKRDGVNLLQAMSKKRLKLIDEFRDKFVTGAKDNQIETAIAEEQFASVIHRGQFTQCKANAISAATIAYQMGYLKSHFPDEFVAASKSVRLQ